MERELREKEGVDKGERESWRGGGGTKRTRLVFCMRESDKYCRKVTVNYAVSNDSISSSGGVTKTTLKKSHSRITKHCLFWW